MEPKLKEQTWSINQIKEFYGVSATTVSSWVRETFPKTKHGRYPILACFKWYKEHVLGRIPPDKSSLAAEKLRRERAKANLEELKYQKETQQVVSFSDIEGWLGRLVVELRQGFLNIPRRMADSLATIQDPKLIEYELREEIHRLLREFTEEANRQINEKRNGGKDAKEKIRTLA